MLDVIYVGILAFCLAIVNDSLGGGYGTISGPILILFGYDPIAIIPTILVSEACSEYCCGALNVKLKNVDFRVFGLTIVGGMIGIISAIFLIGIYLPATMTKTYIGTITVVMGAFVIIKSFRIVEKHSKQHKPSSWKVTLLGLICGFNKSSTGGGYGPISTPGYLLLGLKPAKAVGTTILTKATACLISMVLYAVITGIDLPLMIPMTVGAVTAAPISAWANNYMGRKITPSSHGRFIGIVMTLLGLYTLMKTLRLL